MSVRTNEVTPYWLRITERFHSTTTYFVRYENGLTSYMSSGETPLALSNLVHNAAETRYLLANAVDGETARFTLQEILRAEWAGNPTKTPLVELLDKATLLVGVRRSSKRDVA